MINANKQRVETLEDDFQERNKLNQLEEELKDIRRSVKNKVTAKENGPDDITLNKDSLQHYKYLICILIIS